MARPERNSVDYFPFICSEGKKMYYLEETYGNDGFTVFVKLLRELAKTEYHYLNLSEDITLMFLSAKCKVSKDILESIIKDLVTLKKFDSVLWNENKIIWCQDFIDSIQDAYIKRKNKCITYDGLLHLLISLGIRKQSKVKPSVPVKPQSIVEETIEEEIIVEKTKTEEESIKFICEKFGITELKHFLNYKTINDCVACQFNQGEELFNHFKDQIWNYFMYKEKAKEKLHSFIKFIGSPEEKFIDGGWNAENWNKKHIGLEVGEVNNGVQPKEENKNKIYYGGKRKYETDLTKISKK